MTETLFIEAIGESTFCGYYNGTDHKTDPNACIPLMVKNSVVGVGVACEMDNAAMDGTQVSWHLVYGRGNPSGLARSKANITVINLGINDAERGMVQGFSNDFEDLIDNCKRAGKKVYVTMPNACPAADYDERQRLSGIASEISSICSAKNVELVNSGLQSVQMDDKWHPTPTGYQSLGYDLRTAVAADAKTVSDRARITGMYIGCFNRTPEKAGLDYWTNSLASNDRDYVCQSMVEAGLGTTLTDEEFITVIYQNLLNKIPDSEGLGFWLDVMDDVNQWERGYTLNQMIDFLYYNVNQYDPDVEIYRHRVHCGLAYGNIFGINAVAPDGNLSSVDSEPSSVAAFTANL